MNGETSEVLKKTEDSKAFMAALLVAGEGDCQCRACQILKKMKENMVKEIAGSSSGIPTA